MIYVSQKDSHGCAVACLAMVTGHSYDDIKEFFSVKDFSKQGISFFDINEYLVEHNYFLNWKWPRHQAKGLNKERSIWPPEPWANLHIVEVLQLGGFHHYVVWDIDGVIYDPANCKVTSFNQYQEVCQVIGIK